jgi:hypothetical protein
MQGVLEFHNENLQQHGHVNEAWEESFQSDVELRSTRHTLSRIVHSLPRTVRLHNNAEDNAASAASQGDHYDIPVQDLFDGPELRDLSLGASELEDVSLLEMLAPHAHEVHTDGASGDAEDRVPHDMPATEAYGVLGEEDAHVSRYQEENVWHSTSLLREQQSLRLGSATERPSFRKFETPPPLTEEDDLKLGITWSEDVHGARAVNEGRQENHFAARRRRVYDDQPWPEPLPASAFTGRPREVPVETPERPKKQENDEERVVVRTLRKRLSSFLDGTKA